MSTMDETDQETFEDAREADVLHRPSTSRSLTQSAPASESTIAVESTNLREGNDDALDGKVTEAVNTPSVNASDGNLNSPSPSQEPDVSLTPMLDVNLTDGNDASGNPQENLSQDVHTIKSTPVQSPKDISQIVNEGTKSGLLGRLPSLPFSPSSRTTESSRTPTPSTQGRKLTSPFSWLSRSGAGASSGKTSNNPATPTTPPEMSASINGRRDLVTSFNSSHSGSKVHINSSISERNGHNDSTTLDDEEILRHKFRTLRRQQEVILPNSFGNSEVSASTPKSVLRDNEEHDDCSVRDSASYKSQGGETRQSNSPTDPSQPKLSPPSSIAPTLDRELAPGTAVGMAFSPGLQDNMTVDWDFWQALVYDDPGASRNSGGGDLRDAIARGVPQPIRGVIWQVLAGSKDLKLERIYQKLISPDSNISRNAAVAAQIFAEEKKAMSGRNPERDASHSSKSSIYSNLSSIQDSDSTPINHLSNHSVVPQTDVQQEEKVALDDNLASHSSMIQGKTSAIDRLEKAIRRDLGARTSFSKYLMAAGLQESLFNVCKAYALYDRAIGYAQGINFIAMPLLFNMPEEEAFCLLVSMMYKYGLREMFIQGMPGLHMHLYQYGRLLETLEPKLHAHLRNLGVTPDLYATQWFLTLFAYRFPLQLVLRIHDLVLASSLPSAILRMGLVLMQKNAEVLLSMNDISPITTYLKERLFDVYIDKTRSASSVLESGFFGATSGAIDRQVYRADSMILDACALDISQDLLDAYAIDFSEQQQVSLVHNEEVDTLKNQVVTMSAKIRALEERVQSSDTEHVAAATALVRTKVDNETLSDANEALQSQVGELQRIVDKQSQEVEDRLKAEMDRIMTRNIEVQNANRALEEQLAEMERELVDSKVQQAQMKMEHEALKQKCNSISALLNST